MKRMDRISAGHMTSACCPILWEEEDFQFVTGAVEMDRNISSDAAPKCSICQGHCRSLENIQPIPQLTHLYTRMYPQREKSNWRSDYQQICHPQAWHSFHYRCWGTMVSEHWLSYKFHEFGTWVHFHSVDRPNQASGSPPTRHYDTWASGKICMRYSSIQSFRQQFSTPLKENQNQKILLQCWLVSNGVNIVLTMLHHFRNFVFLQDHLRIHPMFDFTSHYTVCDTLIKWTAWSKIQALDMETEAIQLVFPHEQSCSSQGFLHQSFSSLLL